MRHYKRGRKLGTDASHTAAIKKNLMVNLFTSDRIKTTLERAKEIRGDVDRVVTWAKRGDVHSRQLAIARLGDKELVREIFAKVEQGLFKDRPGGYTRIYKVGKRRGDDAIIVLMELVQEPVQFKKKAGAADEAEKAEKKSGLKVEKKASKGKKANSTEEAAAAVKVDEADTAAEDAVDEADTASAEDAVDEAVSEEAASETDSAVEEAPADEAPTEEAPVEEAPTDEASVEEAPTDEAPSKESSEAEEAPAEDESTK
jgi:large subunit ribosomal protein L17